VIEATDSLLDRLIGLQIGGCTCMTKTPEVGWHKQDCTYRVANEAFFEIVRLSELTSRLAPEPATKPVSCWCPYCSQPHSPRIQEADPAPPTKPCTCPDTTESACGVARGSTLGKLWHCRRAATKNSKHEKG
jgi:hypothetical protein